MTDKPILKVTVFSDYICPFCYIGDVRLNKLREEFDLKVNWCFLEIHPNTPVEGMPVEKLGYPPQQWETMMDGLQQMAAEESLQFAPHKVTANSHKALLMAEAAKELGAEMFYRLHNNLYAAYFTESRNIGDEVVLHDLAVDCGIPEEVVIQSWTDPRYAQRLANNRAAAQELNITGTPTVFFSEKPLSGAVSTAVLFAAAHEAVQKQSGVH